jgi:hypothetical protein
MKKNISLIQPNRAIRPTKKKQHEPIEYNLSQSYLCICFNPFGQYEGSGSTDVEAFPTLSQDERNCSNDGLLQRWLVILFWGTIQEAKKTTTTVLL